MIEEIQIINHWLISKEPYYLQREGIDESYFFALREVVDWINEFYKDTKVLPSLDLTCVQFEEMKRAVDLDPPSYLINVLREGKNYTEFRPIIEQAAMMLNAGDSIGAMWKTRADIDLLINRQGQKISEYDWVKDAVGRYEKYLEKHGKEGLSGLTTGIDGLDDLTGGWRDDDLILLSGRLSEGKSFVGLFCAYKIWRSLVIAGIKQPVVYVTTEMSEIEISYRLDTLKAHFSNRGLNEGKLSDPTVYLEYLEQLASAESSFFVLSQESNGGRPFTPADIQMIIETKKPAFIVIDQLYDMSDGTNERDIRRKIINVTSQIREVNLFTRVPIMLLAQAGRSAAKEAKKDAQATPELVDIQESDNPAQKATRAITLRLLDNRTIKLSLKKNRGGERDKDFYLKVDLDTGIWQEVAEATADF